MNRQLHADLAQQDALLNRVRDLAFDFIHGLDGHAVGNRSPLPCNAHLPQNARGAAAALDNFCQAHLARISGSSGPRYWGFVTGGSTPAALAGDWLTSTFDQNAADAGAQAAIIEDEAIAMLRELFGLPREFGGAFVSGATMSNFSALALARQWIGHRHGVNVALDGLSALPKPITVLSGSPHACIFKALAMLGLGRASLRLVPTLPNREAVDVAALRHELLTLHGAPAIIVGNAGVVNTVDFDDFSALAALKREFNCWLHVDAAFGGFAACSPRFSGLLRGWQAADSITIDCHKWLNVPYDSAIILSRHGALDTEVFQNSAAYLPAANGTDYVHRTPQNSRRLRALPAWLALQAYGVEGHREIVERCCDMAQALAQRIAASDQFVLLADVRMNCVCFTLAGQPSPERVKRFLDALIATNQVFMSPTTLFGKPGIRAAFSNWRTQLADVELAWEVMQAIWAEVN